MTATSLLEVQNLSVIFSTPMGEAHVLRGVDFNVSRGRTVGLVGESGCGKSMTALAILGLIAEPGHISGGAIRLEGENLVTASEKRLRAVRGGRVAMIFQEPMTSLNPVMTVGTQIVEAIMLHSDARAAEARARAVQMLDDVGLPEPARRFGAYPHELSGGMRQRAMIAMAISCRPQLLIADEPTTALDVTVQAQILDLLRDIQQKYGMGLLLISHDMGVIAEATDDVAVMYAGRIVEISPTEMLLAEARHPYTRGLMSCLPHIPGDSERGEAGSMLPEIPGVVPPPYAPGTGCAFAPRCRLATALCQEKTPVLREIISGCHAACHHA